MAVTARALTPIEGPSLYAEALGSSWEGLPPIVRRLHEAGCATGRLTIRRRAGLLPALLGWLCRFPAAGEQVPTRLRIRQEGAVQWWERSFDGHGLTTVQQARGSGSIGERFGPMECVLRLRAVEGGLAYEQVGARLFLGPFRLWLPRVLAPRVEATATEAPQGMRVHVKIGAAFMGWLLSYEGIVSPEEASP